MPATIIIKKIVFDAPQTDPITVILKYKLETDLFWIPLGTVNVDINGNVIPWVTISGLAYSSIYQVSATNTCGGPEQIVEVTTADAGCPAIVNIVMSITNVL